MSDIEILLSEIRDNLGQALTDPHVVKQLEYLDCGIGTSTPSAIWLVMRNQHQQLCKLVPPSQPETK